MKLANAFISIAMLLLVYSAGLLIGPRFPDSDEERYCVFNIHFTSIFGFGLNCDSPEMLDDANQLSLLLKPGSMRQARPGLIVLAHLLSLPFKPMMSLFANVDVDRLHGPTKRIDKKAAFLAWGPPYAGYLIINFGLVLGAVYLYLSTIRSAFAARGVGVPFSAAAIGVMLTFNDVTKAFIWSPHWQMFNIFIPVFCVFAFVDAIERSMLDEPRSWYFSLICGLGILTYPAFILFLPTVYSAALWLMLRRRVAPPLLRLAVMTVICLAPNFLWWAFLKLATGSYTLHESASYFREVVWMLDARANGIGWLIRKFCEFAAMAVTESIAQGAIALAIAGVSLVLLVRSSPARIGEQGIVHLGCAVFALWCVTFLMIIGFAPWRLAFLAVPSMVIAAGVLAGQLELILGGIRRRIFRGTILTLMIGQGIYVVAKSTPIS